MTRRDESGSAGLLVVWTAVIVVLTTAVAALWSGVVVARHRAARVADAAALAAARGAAVPWAAADPTPSEGCTAAARVAAAQGGRLEDCRLLPDGSALVLVSVAGPAAGGPLGLAGGGRAAARARAGVPP